MAKKLDLLRDAAEEEQEERSRAGCECGDESAE
jgi:hypothetical protein